VFAPRDAVVEAVLVKAGDVVTRGVLLVKLAASF